MKITGRVNYAEGIAEERMGKCKRYGDRQRAILVECMRRGVYFKSSTSHHARILGTVSAKGAREAGGDPMRNDCLTFD